MVIALLVNKFAEVVVTAAVGVVLAALEASRRVKAASANATGESTGSGALPPDVGSTGEVAAAVTRADTVAVVWVGTFADVVGATALFDPPLGALTLVFVAWLVPVPDEVPLEC